MPDPAGKIVLPDTPTAPNITPRQMRHVLTHLGVSVRMVKADTPGYAYDIAQATWDGVGSFPTPQTVRDTWRDTVKPALDQAAADADAAKSALDAALTKLAADNATAADLRKIVRALVRRAGMA